MEDDAWDRYDGRMQQLEAAAANLARLGGPNMRGQLEGLVRQQVPRVGKERQHYLVATLIVRLWRRAPPDQQAGWARLHAAFPPYDAGGNF